MFWRSIQPYGLGRAAINQVAVGNSLPSVDILSPSILLLSSAHPPFAVAPQEVLSSSDMRLREGLPPMLILTPFHRTDPCFFFKTWEVLVPKGSLE